MSVCREIADSDHPTALVFEDDARLCDGFRGQLVETCGALADEHPGFDVALLGYFVYDDALQQELRSERVSARLTRIDWDGYLGGTFAYLLLRHGARKLLALAERDGVQNGIDWFVKYRANELHVLGTAPNIAFSEPALQGSNVDSDVQYDFDPVAADGDRPADSASAGSGL